MHKIAKDWISKYILETENIWKLQDAPLVVVPQEARRVFNLYNLELGRFCLPEGGVWVEGEDQRGLTGLVDTQEGQMGVWGRRHFIDVFKMPKGEVSFMIGFLEELVVIDYEKHRVGGEIVAGCLVDPETGNIFLQKAEFPEGMHKRQIQDVVAVYKQLILCGYSPGLEAMH